MQMKTMTAGKLTCRIVDAIPVGETPKLLVILNHGFGASGEDLVDLAPWLCESDQRVADSCRFVFPEAPIDLGPMGMPGGRAWWPINMARLAEINQTRDFDQLTTLRPDGMTEASQKLADAVTVLQSGCGLTDAATVLGGFSQGAMVSTDVVLRRGFAPALLTLFSGTLLCRQEWADLAAAHVGCRVLQSHGKVDPILPLLPATQLRDLLTQNKFTVEFCEFYGPHTIPEPVLERFGRLLSELLVGFEKNLNLA